MVQFTAHTTGWIRGRWPNLTPQEAMILNKLVRGKRTTMCLPLKEEILPVGCVPLPCQPNGFGGYQMSVRVGGGGPVQGSPTNKFDKVSSDGYHMSVAEVGREGVPWLGEGGGLCGARGPVQRGLMYHG